MTTSLDLLGCERIDHGYHVLDDQAVIEAEVVKTAQDAARLTLNQYKAGTVNYLNVVIVQTAQLNNEATAVNLLGQRLVAAVTLVQALGGGWSTTQLSSVK